MAQCTMSKVAQLTAMFRSVSVNLKPAAAALSTMKHQMTKPGSKTAPEHEITKSVFISQSRDIFTNLALEDWLYHNLDFTNHHVLFLWQNSPTVVIGRHQNPWLEANTLALMDRGVEIARRNSGGGTVYHDEGNLNLSFFTARDCYNRRRNLDVISRALFREFNICTQVNSREDIVINGNQKISGTASKLGNPNSYHHCTVLVHVHNENLRATLSKADKGIHTNATASVPSPIMNLQEVNPHVTVDKLVSAVGWEFMRSTALSAEDGGKALASRQRGFQLVNPTNDWFPGLDKTREEFASWEWRFGKTPKFHVTRSFAVPEPLAQAMDPAAKEGPQELTITLDVNKGVINDVTLKIPPSMMTTQGFTGDAKVLTSLRGRRFCESAMEILEDCLGKPNRLASWARRQERSQCEPDSERFMADCMRQVMMAV